MENPDDGKKVTAVPFVPLYAMSRVPETAKRMMDRYSSHRVAHEMAWLHACDYPRDSRQWRYWDAVAFYIQNGYTPE